MSGKQGDLAGVLVGKCVGEAVGIGAGFEQHRVDRRLERLKPSGHSLPGLAIRR